MVQYAERPADRAEIAAEPAAVQEGRGEDSGHRDRSRDDRDRVQPQQILSVGEPNDRPEIVGEEPAEKRPRIDPRGET